MWTWNTLFKNNHTVYEWLDRKVWWLFSKIQELIMVLFSKKMFYLQGEFQFEVMWLNTASARNWIFPPFSGFLNLIFNFSIFIKWTNVLPSAFFCQCTLKWSHLIYFSFCWDSLCIIVCFSSSHPGDFIKLWCLKQHPFVDVRNTWARNGMQVVAVFLTSAGD